MQRTTGTLAQNYKGHIPMLHLQIRDFILNIHLGVEEEERAQTQPVLVTIDLFFLQAPVACMNDQLKDTFCYAALLPVLTQAATKPFHLIEHLSYVLYQCITEITPKETKIKVTVHKKPKLENLSGGVLCSYGDQF